MVRFHSMTSVFSGSTTNGILRIGNASKFKDAFPYLGEIGSTCEEKEEKYNVREVFTDFSRFLLEPASTGKKWQTRSQETRPERFVWGRSAEDKVGACQSGDRLSLGRTDVQG